MKTGALKEISFPIPMEAEDPVSALVERLVGYYPTIYSDFETRETRAYIYMPVKKWSAAFTTRLKKELVALADFGWAIPVKSLTVRTLKHQDWAEVWKRHFPPLNISNRLLVKPGWNKLKPLKNQAVIVLDPGLSFGTGHHATTSFCLEQLVRLQGKQPLSLLDAGCGSGILAIAAAKLGYRPVHAFDFDPQAVKVARENLLKNKVSDQVRLARKDLIQMESRGQKYDVICANLLADLLIQEARKLRGWLKPGGHLIAAGILRTQFADVRRAFEKLGLVVTAVGVEKEWQSAVLEFRP